MEELPRALIKERMVTVNVIAMVIMMIVMVVMLEKELSTREFAVPVTHLKEEPDGKMSKRASLTKFEQVLLSLILLPSILALCHSAVTSSALPGSQVSSLEVAIVHKFA